MQRNITPFLIVLIALGGLAGVYGGYKRYQAENLNRAIELAVDYSEVHTLAAMTGRRPDEVLQELKNAGVTSVAVTEDTIGSLESAGALKARTVTPLRTEVDTLLPGEIDRLKAEISARGIRAGLTEAIDGKRPYTAFRGPNGGFMAQADYGTLRNVGAGLNPEALATVNAAGLQPVARVSNFEGISAARIQAIVQRLQSQGIKTVVFQGTEVLGYRGLHKETAAALDAAGINFGWIEFGKQKGEERLGDALDSRYVRVHSISETELGTMTDDDILDRFVKAGRERNIRLLYLRLPIRAGDDPVGANAAFIGRIMRGLERGGMLQAGVAHPYEETHVPLAAFALMALGAAAGLTLLGQRFANFSSAFVIGLWILASAACLGLVVATGESGRKLAALLAAMVFPTLACLRRDLLQTPAAEDTAPAETRGGAAVKALAGLAAASGITAIGIAHVVGLLATRPFLVKTEQFMGIKAAHALPIVLIGLIAILGLPRLDRAWADERLRLKERFAHLMDEPTRVGPILLTLAAMAALLIIVARTGNEPGVGVSGIELKFRAVLDRLLGVRPRTKEFLIGHPAFVLALALWFRGRRRIALPLFVVGVLGQVSILNTFCHIHTPLVVSAIRDATGLVLGAILGLAAFFAVEVIIRPKPAVETAEPEPSGSPRATATT